MSISRKHFEEIAETIRTASVNWDSEETITALEFVAHHIADTLKKANPSFNRAKFLEACHATE